MDQTRARVVRAKLVRPAPPASMLVRQRLVDRLVPLLQPRNGSQLGLVTAPAGFGKTTLLSKVAIRGSEAGVPVAWCSLDHSDANSFRFWSSVLSALSLPDGGLAEALAPVPAPHRAGSPDFVTRVVQALEVRPVVLILENLHEITDPGVLGDLDFLLTHLPDGVAVLLSSRSDPPLPALQTAKVSGTLTQLRAADLAFTADETDSWCQDLAPELVRMVWERTEGWPAMVRLMHLAVRSGEEPLEDPATDVGLADYLFHEALRRQPDDLQRAVMLMAVPDTITVDLATELTGRADAGELLRRVMQSSGLISSSWHAATNSPVYRMHPMLRAYLHGELQRRDRDATRLAHQTTARWCLATGFDLDAVRHATASGDTTFQESVVSTAGPGLVNAGEAGMLLGALDLPGRRRGEESVWTSLIRAAALLDTGRLHEAAAELQRVEPHRIEHDGADIELALLRQATEAHLLRRRGSFLDVTQTRPPLGSEDPDLRLILAAQRGSALVWQGDIDASEAELKQGIEIARGLGRTAALIDCLAFLGGVHSSRSRFVPMRDAVQEAIDLGEAHGWADTPRVAYPHMLRAWAAYQDLDNDLARAHLSRAVALVEPTADPTVLISISALDTALSYDELPTEAGDSRAEDASNMHEVMVTLPGHELAPTLVTYAALTDARMALQTQRLNRVPELVALLRTRFGPCGEADLIQAMYKEATGKRADARALLADVTKRPESLIGPLAEAEVLVFASVLAHTDGDAFNATALARRGLDVTQRLHGFRPLVDAGDVFHTVLREGIGRWGVHDQLVSRVLERGAHPPSVSTIALTARELEVLRELPSLNTVDDIAGVLFVSVNTVKTHLRSLYRKLEVASRRDAVAAARRLGLL